MGRTRNSQDALSAAVRGTYSFLNARRLGPDGEARIYWSVFFVIISIGKGKPKDDSSGRGESSGSKRENTANSRLFFILLPLQYSVALCPFYSYSRRKHVTGRRGMGIH